MFGALMSAGACTATVPATQDAAPAEATKVEEEKPVEEEKVAPPEPEQTPPETDVARPAGLPEEQFMFVFRGEVAIETAAKVEWGTGEVRSKETKEGLEGRQDVDAAQLPEALRRLDGAAVTLYGAKGKVCEAALKGLVLYGLSERGDEAASEKELPSMPVVMAGLTDKKGSCDGAVWARRSDAPAPVVFTPGPADAALVKKARAAVQQLGRYAAMKAEYPEEDNDLPGRLKWEKFASKQLRAKVWSEVGGPRELLVVELGEPEWVKCDAHFSEWMAAVFAVEGSELKLLSEDGAWQPTAMFDANSDGVIETVMTPPGGVGGLLLAATRKGGEVVDELRFPSEGPSECADGDDGGAADEP